MISNRILGTVGLVIGGVVVMVVGLVMAPTVIDQAATTGASTNIGSFSGASSFNDLQPLFYYIILTVVSLGLMTAGGVIGIRGR